jgi:uncharacterized protein YcfL
MFVAMKANLFTSVALLVLAACNTSEETVDAETQDTISTTTETIAADATTEDHELEDVTVFNMSIADRTDLVTVDDVVTEFYAYDPADGPEPPQIEISSGVNGNSHTATLIHENLPDDSMAAQKIVLTATNDNGRWTVIEIRRSWKCQNGRGESTNWHAQVCN